MKMIWSNSYFNKETKNGEKNLLYDFLGPNTSLMRCLQSWGLCPVEEDAIFDFFYLPSHNISKYVDLGEAREKIYLDQG